MTNYISVIGLEVHSQLLTESKAFSSSSTQFGDNPNSNTDLVTLGFPGTLPVINEKLVKFAVKMGLATNCKIRELNKFDRKNYFYPDLTKGYQISQHEGPICYDGFIEIELNEEIKKIGITRIHMEEDTGKSIHDIDIDTLLDYNRAGVPLIEIVSEPDLRSSEQAYKYLMNLKQILVYCGISTGNMEEGALRCDVNISVMPEGSDKFGTKVEIKNLNSFRNVEKAIEYEIIRQTEIYESGGKVIQETRMWDASKQKTISMRTKETARDYRYFPEPDLPMIKISQEYIESVKAEIPELPSDRKKRFISEFSLPNYDSTVLVEDKELADYYESCIGNLENKNEKTYKLVSNWIMTEILRLKSENLQSINNLGIDSKIISQLVDLIYNDKISSKIAKDIFPELIEKKKMPIDLINEKGLNQVSDSNLIEDICKKVIAENPDNVEKYKQGRTNLLGFFVGLVMKETKGKANPKIVNDMVIKYLEN